ncbi:hypothetical protein Tco_1421607, partial [Tanacetum coccineum]
EYGVSNSIGYGVSSSVSNIAYSSKLINTAYPLPLDTAYRSSETKTEFLTLSLDELRSPDFNLLSDQEYSEEEEAEAMTETMEQYMSKTQTDYGSGVAGPKIDNKDQFELKGQFLKELRENTFSGSDNEDANEHIEKVLEIVDLLHVPNITVDQLMLRVFPISLTGAASHWLRNEPTGSIKTWEDLKTKFLNKYCPPGRTAKKMEESNNFQQEPDETLFQACERFKELLMKCLSIKMAKDAKAIHEWFEYSQKWHNGPSRGRSTKTSDGLAAIQAQLNNLGREIKKVNEKVLYSCLLDVNKCKGLIFTKIAHKKRGINPRKNRTTCNLVDLFRRGILTNTAPGYYQRNNANPSYQERRKSMEETLSKFMSESAKRHDENSSLIKEIRAMTDAAKAITNKTRPKQGKA